MSYRAPRGDAVDLLKTGATVAGLATSPLTAGIGMLVSDVIGAFGLEGRQQAYNRAFFQWYQKALEAGNQRSALAQNQIRAKAFQTTRGSRDSKLSLVKQHLFLAALKKALGL